MRNPTSSALSVALIANSFPDRISPSQFQTELGEFPKRAAAGQSSCVDDKWGDAGRLTCFNIQASIFSDRVGNVARDVGCAIQVPGGSPPE